MNSFTSVNSIFTNAQSLFPLDYDSSLIIYYPFNGNLLNYATGIGVSDSTPTNSVQLSSDKSVNGKTSLFNNNSGYLAINKSSYPTNTLGYTLSFWIYEASNITNGGIFAFGDGAGNVMYAYINGSFQIVYTNTSSYIVSSTISTNTWYHVAINANPTNVKIYLNGVINVNQTTTNRFPTTISSSGNYLLNTPCIAYMYNFRLYNRSLSATEIMQLYNYRKP